MARTIDLGTRINRLLEEREEHSTALARIEETIGQLDSLLGNFAGNGRRGPGRPPGRSPGRPKKEWMEAPAAPVKRRKRGRGAYKSTAEQLVLSFVAQKKNPTTGEINAHWIKEGRGNKADNTLGKLVKDKKLKRTNLVGERGSRYALV